MMLVSKLREFKIGDMKLGIKEKQNSVKITFLL